MSKKKGKAWKFGAHIDTDAILPAAFLNQTEPEALASHCFEFAAPEFCTQAKPGDYIVADVNFGCGSSREHAPVAIKAKGIDCVIAASFARIFFRNAFNIGLAALESAEAVEKIEAGHELSVDMAKGIITNHTTGENYQCEPIPPNMLKILEDGGMIPHLAAKNS